MKIILDSYLGLNIDAAINAGFPEKASLEKIGDRTHVSYLKTGIDFGIDSSDQIIAVHAYGNGDKEFGKFTGDLPGGLDFSLARDSVRRLLGEPVFEGGGAKSILVRCNIFEQFILDNTSIAVHYSEDGSSVARVTLQRSNSQNGKREPKPKTNRKE